MIDYIKKNLKLLFIVLAGFVFLMITILPSGSRFCYQSQCGIFIWGANGHDGIWHLSLISTAFKQFPFIIPIYKNGLLAGYNYFMDFSLYLLTFLGFSPQFLFFKLIPIVWFIGFCYFLILLGRKIIDNTTFIFWLLFFSFFGSSFTFLLTLYHKGTIWGASSLVSMQSGQVLTNIQFALSLVGLLIIFYILKTKKLNYMWTCVLGFLLFLNLGLKFYGGFVSAASVYIYLFLEYIESKDKFKLKRIINAVAKYSVLSLFVVLAIIMFYDPFHSFKSGSTFIFSPLSVIHPMIEEPALFYWLKMANARYFLYTKGFGLRLLLIELFSTGIFLFFSLGLRIFAFIEIGIKLFKKTVSKFDLAILLAAFSAFLFCILFVQKGEWWNVIQFYYYTLFILNVYTALFIYRLLKQIKNKLLTILIIGIIIILTLPGNLDILKTFSRFPAQVYIPDAELQALAFLKKQPKGVVLTQQQNKSLTRTGKMNPIVYIEDSAYISAFSSKQTYINDFIVLNNMSIDYKKRLERLKASDCSIIDEVTYVYQLKSVPDDFFSNCVLPEQEKLKKIFENSEVIIYKR